MEPRPEMPYGEVVTRFVQFVLLQLIACAVFPGMTFAQDTIPPQLEVFSFTPTSVDTASESATVTANFTVTDNLSGVTLVQVAFAGPSNTATSRQGSASFGAATRVSGSVTVTLPQLSEPGTWKVAAVVMSDATGNTKVLNTAVLKAAGFPTELQVRSNTDTAPPALTAFSLTPNIIDTTSRSANVTVGFTATDDLAGVKLLQVNFVSPSGASSQATATLTPATKVTSSVVVTFPPFSESGAWTVSGVFLLDAANNSLVLSTEELAGRGFPVEFRVTSATDTTPPNLTAFSFTPATIDVSSGPNTVTISAAVTDDLSGATIFQVGLVSPSGGASQSGSASFKATPLTTGWVPVTFPQGSEEGIWTVSTVFLSDAVGNTRVLNAGDLAALGFPTHLTVTNQGHQLVSLNAALFIGLTDENDQGTNFDLRVEMLKNGAPVALGQTQCITGLTRNPDLAKEISVPFDRFSSVPLASGDVLSLKVLTRINADPKKCPGHSQAAGLRLYQDPGGRYSRLGVQISPYPMTEFFLQTTDNTDSFDIAAPTGAKALFKDSPPLALAGRNAFQVIGTWSRLQP